MLLSVLLHCVALTYAVKRSCENTKVTSIVLKFPTNSKRKNDGRACSTIYKGAVLNGGSLFTQSPTHPPNKHQCDPRV